MQVPRTGMPARMRSRIGSSSSIPVEQLADGRALAAGKDERVHLVQLRAAPHRHRLGARLFGGAQVLRHVPLQGEDADPALHHPRGASSSFSAIWRDIQAGHRLAQPLRDLGQELGIVVVRHRVHDRLRPRASDRST